MDERDKDVSVRAVSRREFLKIAGAAGAAVGLGAGMGGLLAACGEEEESTTTSAAESTTTTAAATTTSAAATTTTSGEPATGREIKIGFVAPLTGGLASFGVADRYCLERWEELVVDGWDCGDGKTTPDHVLPSGQSVRHQPGFAGGRRPDPEREDRHHDGRLHTGDGQPGGRPVRGERHPLLQQRRAVAGLLLRPRRQRRHAVQVDLPPLLGSRGPHRRLPGRLGADQTPTRSSALCGRTTRTGTRSPIRPPVSRLSASRSVTPLSTPVGIRTASRTSPRMISQFKNEGCEIVTGVPIPPDFTNFWKQATQQGFQPKMGSIAKALDLPVGRRGSGRRRQQLHRRVPVDPADAVQVVAHRRDLPAVRRRVREARRDPVGPVPASLRRVRGGRETRSSAARMSMTKRPSSRRSRPRSWTR